MNRFHQQPNPLIEPRYWGFMLGGLVRVPLMLSYADIRALPAVDQSCVFTCVGNTPGSQELQSTVWQGVHLQTLLDAVQIHPQVQFAHFFAADGYVTSIALEHLSGAVLAYLRNGFPLKPEEGHPVRLIVPGLYGYKMPKWIQRIEMRKVPISGRWEQRGWSTAGMVQTTSAITHPRHLDPISGITTIAGTAFAGGRSVIQIEISIDDAPWMPVPFSPVPTGHLIRWSIAWAPPAPGDYRVKVRAADNTGFVQAENTPVFPNGSSAIHAITLRVVGTQA